MWILFAAAAAGAEGATAEGVRAGGRALGEHKQEMWGTIAMLVPRSSPDISALEYVGLSGILTGLLGSRVEMGTAKIKSRNVLLKSKVSQKGSALKCCPPSRAVFVWVWGLSISLSFWIGSSHQGSHSGLPKQSQFAAEMSPVLALPKLV